MGTATSRTEHLACPRKITRAVHPDVVSQGVRTFCRCQCILIEYLNRWVASEKGTRIGISVFHSALKISGMDVSMEEAECLLANQVYKGYMKGYISHEKQMVVLSNVNAFPKLADRPAPFSLLYA